MSAEDNLSSQQWEQLPMFMSASEIMGKVNSSADAPGAKMEDVWHQKLYEAKTGAIRNALYVPTRKRRGNSLYESIQNNGVREPVQLNRNGAEGYSLAEGHHRVAAAHDIDPNMMLPVVHSDELEFQPTKRTQRLLTWQGKKEKAKSRWGKE